MANNFQITALNQQGVATVLHPESNADQVLPGTSTKVPLRTEITKWNERADEVEVARDGKANLKAKIDDVVTKLTGTITTVRTSLEETISLLDNKTSAEDARLLSRMDGIKTNLQTQIDTWNNFKDNGGAIGGDVISDGYASTKQGFVLKRDKGAITVEGETGLAEAYTQFWRDGSVYMVSKMGGSSLTTQFAFKEDMFACYGTHKDIGDPQNPWRDIFLTGASKSLNGYKRIGDGMILQWFTVGAPNGNVASTHSYPISFPNSALAVIANASWTGASGDFAVSSGTQGTDPKTKCWIYHRNPATISVRVFAIGY